MKCITNATLYTNAILLPYAVRSPQKVINKWKGEKRLLVGIWFLKIESLVQDNGSNTKELEK